MEKNITGEKMLSHIDRIAGEKKPITADIFLTNLFKIRIDGRLSSTGQYKSLYAHNCQSFCVCDKILISIIAITDVPIAPTDGGSWIQGRRQ